MLKFRELLTESKVEKLTHLEHLEDEIFNGGVVGTRSAINFLRGTRDMLNGHSKNTVNVTSKWDGAPSLVVGTNPDNGKFFVASKGAFANNPKLYYDEKSIMQNEPSGKAEKMALAFRYLSKLNIKQILQGDLMFTQDMLKKETIDGEDYLTFHPNTIVYAVPENSQAAKEIRRAKFGIIFHTHYTGKDFASMKANFGLDLSHIKKSPDVWMKDALLKDVSGTATLTDSETETLANLLSTAGKLFNKIPASFLNEISEDEQLKIDIKSHDNQKIRQGKPISSVTEHVESLLAHIKSKYEYEIEKRKTEKGKEPQRELLKKYLDHVKKNKKNFELTYELYNTLVYAKSILLTKLNTIKTLGTFIKTADGFKVTSPEGYVAIDKLSGGVVKLVDRMEFSKANFSADVRKGWGSV